MKIVDNPSELLIFINDLVKIADNYKNEIGFWPFNSLKDAIVRGRLIAAVEEKDGREQPIGFLVFGGVFPNASIQAVAVSPDELRRGVAQNLITSIIAKLEFEGFLAISAKPAKDLLVAQKFYERNLFYVVRTRSGGKTRKREIVVRERTLSSPSLLNSIEQPKRSRLGSSSDKFSDLWVIDINVLFDLVKPGRAQYSMAAEVFRAALDGRVRVAVSSEFTAELERRSPEGKTDPYLEMARALPKLRRVATSDLNQLSDEIHELLFEKEKPSQAGTPQARSDCLHISECIIGNASAFITSDGVLLRNRRLIRERWGLEIAALEDFFEILTSTVIKDNFQPTQGDGFRLQKQDFASAKQLANRFEHSVFDADFFSENATRETSQYISALTDTKQTVGLLASIAPEKLGDPHRLKLQISHDHPHSELIADTLLNQAIDTIGKSGVGHIELVDEPGQIITRKAATQAGFKTGLSYDTLSKTVIGSPITPSNFWVIKDRLRLASVSDAFSLFPDDFYELDQLFVSDPEGFVSLEKMLSPTLIIPNSRRVCIQPIAQSYAAQLLGTSNQTSLLEQYEGVFRSQKIYVSSGRSRNQFETNQVILFYESSRTGGRGAIVAAARVDNVVTQQKSDTNIGQMKRTVLDSVDRYSASSEVTLTGFSSVLRFPRPISLAELRRIKATGTKNLQSTTIISTEAAQHILDLGWSNAR